MNSGDDKGSPSEMRAPRFFDRLKETFGLTELPTLRAQLEQLLRWGKDSDDSFSVPERTMLRNVLRFGALRVEDVMVPRADIIAVDEQSSLEDLLRLFEAAGHSRVPVYRETLDEPVGMVHVKDLLRWILRQNASEKNDVATNGSGNGDAAEEDSDTSDASADMLHQISLKKVELSETVAAARLKREVLFVPPSMPVADLLLRMQTTHVHLALVVDEYGGTDGLVSIEDLVEEIVGEIEDEHDVTDGPLLRPTGSEGFVADARTPIDELKEKIDVDLSLTDKEDDEVDTLGGLVFSIAGRVPVRGELIPHPSGIEFEVLDADPRRIKRLRVHLQSASKAVEPTSPPNSV